MLEEQSNNNSNNHTIKNNIMDAVILDRDGKTSSILRQNSNSSINSSSAMNVLSPTNVSEHSNCSISSSMAQTVDTNTEILSDLNTENTTKNKCSTNISLKEDDSGNSSSEKSTIQVKNLSSAAQAINLLTTVKEEPNVLSTVVNIKKEENSLTPNISPVGFGSIVNVVGTTADGTGRAITPGEAKNAETGNEKRAPALVPAINCNEDSGSNPTLSNIVSSNGCGGNTQQSSTTNLNSSNSGGSVTNCVDYMQQQNHIFVFSTQLANKGAESVLSGQFPTIIAYHCTQPATKSFLEDFFIKNPMKVSKLQRQNSINMCNISIQSSQQWISGCNSVSKVQQKSIGGKINFNSLNTNTINKSVLRTPNVIGFPEPAEGLSNDNDLMCWEPTRNSLETTADNVETISGSRHNLGINQHTATKPIITVDATADNNIPSLQGVKVPDENLTPQQRQHREEQLAKLKKMNQFLFPENGNDFRLDGPSTLQSSNQMGKSAQEAVGGNMPSIIRNISGSSPTITPQIGNHLNSAIRNIPSNSINQNKGSLCSSENMTILGDESVGPSDIVAHDMGRIQCNTTKSPCSININNQSNLSCGSSSVVGTIVPNTTSAPIPGNPTPCHSGGINGPTNLLPNSPEGVNNFNKNSGVDGSSKTVGTNIHSQDISHIGMAQIEWSKLQQQFFEERMKEGKSGSDITNIPVALCRSNSAGIGVNVRPIIGASCVSASSSGNSQSIRSLQGPPPPYHLTQRSASVPIATVSPNPASPNNPTSNLSLPSPRTSGALGGIPANSPNLDVHIGCTTAPTPTISAATTTVAITSTIPAANIQSINTYQGENSPTNGNYSSNRNRGNHSQFNSNPSTPVSNMSPKDLESFNTGDLKNSRRSPQKSRSPLITSNLNNIAEPTTTEGGFPLATPILNFSGHMQNTPNITMNSYKAPGSIERQNSAPVSSHYCRRTDNLPLNPNSSRPSQSKLNHSFDPISSLAQMSQQLTNCVSLNTGIGNPSTGISIINANDMNISSNINQNMEGIMGLDSCLDHCGPSTVGNIGMAPHVGGSGPFISNNCHLNSMLSPMGQRLLNPKMCGGFSPVNGGVRETSNNFHGVLPSHRLIGRMPVNFSNYNVSPNIQVKASTPNTIQYMPVRPQNNNTNNMRMPPSLEFLQRYANPHISSGLNVIDNGHIGQTNSGSSTEPAKLSNNTNAPGGNLNFFQNCNQIGLNTEQEDMLLTHNINIGSHTSLIRGMRPVRQHNLGHDGSNSAVSVSRLQAPGPNMIGSMPHQFSSSPQDSMENSDTAGLYNTSESGQIYAGVQQKSMKIMNQNLDSLNSGINGQGPNSGILSNDHISGIQSSLNGSVLMGSNNNVLNQMSAGNTPPLPCAGSNSNINYKPFVGPTTNDLKYAQQYHSFQQQLYATSTRSQQGVVSSNMVPNSTTNSGFFVNK